RIAIQEHADRFIVGMAALLHDIGRTTQEPNRPHAERSAIIATELLAQYDLPHQTQQAILHAILAHNYRRGITPETLEARVLYDADRLDSMGATGLMRWAMTIKHKKWSEWKSYHPDDPFAVHRTPDDQRYLLDRFFTKLLSLPDAMMTETGQALAHNRLTFFSLFLQELQVELVDGGYSGAELGNEFFHIVH
ncbi:MAG: HD domain-containing protein, partial [Ktedonobacteraceae bacterium]